MTNDSLHKDGSTRFLTLSVLQKYSDNSKVQNCKDYFRAKFKLCLLKVILLHSIISAQLLIANPCSSKMLDILSALSRGIWKTTRARYWIILLRDIWRTKIGLVSLWSWNIRQDTINIVYDRSTKLAWYPGKIPRSGGENNHRRLLPHSKLVHILVSFNYADRAMSLKPEKNNY